MPPNVRIVMGNALRLAINPRSVGATPSLLICCGMAARTIQNLILLVTRQARRGIRVLANGETNGMLIQH